MIQSRLRHRLRALNLSDFESYTKLLNSDAGRSERKQLISALTTNVSHFFRENHHFEMLCGQLLSNRINALRAGGKLRIWSAGCSNGQEAFSVAMALLTAEPEIANLDVKILATDIDPVVVEFAQKARFAERYINGIPNDLLLQHFARTDAPHETVYEAKLNLRKMVRFKELNLLGAWPMKSTFDAIFCRNVVIYFDQPTQNQLWPRFKEILLPDGLLFLGHSERIPAPEKVGFHTIGPTSYQRHG